MLEGRRKFRCSSEMRASENKPLELLIQILVLWKLIYSPKKNQATQEGEGDRRRKLHNESFTIRAPCHTHY
jgi:hypothetical protein